MFNTIKNLMRALKETFICKNKNMERNKNIFSIFSIFSKLIHRQVTALVILFCTYYILHLQRHREHEKIILEK